jgi:hypothetical protein
VPPHSAMAELVSAMPIFLEVRSGSQTGRRIRVETGHPVRIGRTLNADVAFADDSHMSGIHFSIEYLQNQCCFADLNSSNGSWLNGERVSHAVLSDGDMLIAGETKFAITVEAEDAPTAEIAAPLPPETLQERLLALFRNDFQPLFAILDAARDVRILALLLTHRQEEYQSLYEGQQGAELAQVAPYLVRLGKESPLLEALVKEGWGKSWGVYLTSTAEFNQVRHHLRRFLQVRLPSGEQVYFRFYDPRVMRVFLPTCTPEDTVQFFGPIENYLVEDEMPERLCRFKDTGRGSAKKQIMLQPPEEQPKVSPSVDELSETDKWPEGFPQGEAS